MEELNFDVLIIEPLIVNNRIADPNNYKTIFENSTGRVLVRMDARAVE